ncbi:MAG: phosphate ABC transporter ATP-binding protein [Desulfurococcales archaeon]|nr:phosphate ABC transporter ATP-binding protein [Desulfurococcales archaeon]
MTSTSLELERALEVKGLNVWLGEKQILHNITFKVNRGEILAIMGPSGSGKSTLLRAISRLLDHRTDARVRGEVLINGINVYTTNPYKARKYIGIVFQNPNPFPHMTIYDNIAVGPKLHKLVRSKTELDNLVRWALKSAMLWDDVKEKLNSYPAELSGGQQQRLCLARALAMRPKLLLLDEPTANIDPVNAKKIENIVKKMSREESVAVVIVTHTPAQAMRISDKVLFLFNGKTIEYGPTQVVASNPDHDLTQSFLRGEI